MVLQKQNNDISRESSHKRAWKQPSNTITVTSGWKLLRVTVIMLGTMWENTSTVDYIIRFLYQRMNVTIYI